MKLVNYDKTRAAMAPFETIEQLNANTKAIREQYSEIMTTSEKAVLDVLHRYASSFYGVTYLAKSTIAEMVNLSRRQVIRICQRFEELGIIVQYATDRKRGGGQTSNTIVFLTQISARDAFVNECEQVADNMQEINESEFAENADVTGDVTPHVTGLDALSDTPKELKDLKITKDTDAREALLKQGLVSKLPKTLQHALAPFFDADELYEMAGVIFKAKASVDKSVVIEYNEKLYYDAILSVMNAYGRGKVKSVAAVLYRAIERTTSAIVSASRNDVRRNLYGL